MTKRHKNIKFSFETEKDFPFSMLGFIEKKINFQQVFSEMICSVVYTLV